MSSTELSRAKIAALTAPTTDLGLCHLEGSEWPEQGSWTWEDHQRLPDDGLRYEILGGVLYVSPAPSFNHQFSATELIRQLANFVRERGLGLVLAAPFDIRLSEAADPVEPDIVVFRTGNTPRPGDKHFVGVPDLLVEVLSPGSRSHDLGVKLRAYESAGVPEYWVVDPESRTVTVHVLDDACYGELGTFGAGEWVRSRELEGFDGEVASFFVTLEG